MGALSNVPGLAGFLEGQQIGERQQMGQLQQVGALQGILAQVQAQKQKQAALMQEQALRGELAQLGPNPSQESLAAIAAKYAPAKDILTSQTASADRKAAMQAAALNQEAMRGERAALQTERLDAKRDELLQRAEDKRSTDAERREARMELARFMVANRAPRAEPAPRNLQLTTDAAGNQLIVNPDGTTRPLTTQDGSGVQKPVAADKPMTEFQGKAALYGTRTAQSDKVLKALEDKIFTTGLAMGQATGVVGSALMSSEQQRVTQAQRDFVNAVLRQESGAVISDAEFANAKKQYFPQPGDEPAVRAQKRANRQLAIQGFARMSGPKGALDIKAINDEPLLPGAPATNPTPQQAGGKIGAPGSGWKVTPVQ